MPPTPSQSPEAMPKPPQAPLAPAADLVSRMWNRFRRLFSVLFPWMVLSCIGSLLMAAGQLKGTPFTTLNVWASAVLLLIGGLITLVSYLTMARIVAGVEGDPHDILGSGRSSLKLFFPYIWMLILQGFIMLGSFAFFLIPGIIFSVYLAVLLFVFVVEGGRSVSAFTRSWGYVAGRWWETLWRMAVILFLTMLAMILLSIILALGFGGGTQNWGATLVQSVVEAFIFGPLLLCYLFELYTDLRATKPSADVAAETAKLWLVIFLIIGIMLALLIAFGLVTQTAIHGGRNWSVTYRQQQMFQ